MGKSSKATVLKRIQEVSRLILAGGEFPDVRQYAAEQDWKVSDRQLHRYMSVSHKRMAKAAKRNTEELVGRHLMQRRALYARCIKANDLRTALAVLNDEANLQGLYPPKKIAPTTPDGEQPYVMQTQATVTLVSLQERVVRLVMADAQKDRTAVELVKQSSPRITFEAPDTFRPTLMLNTLATAYACEQLEQAGLFFQTMFLVARPLADSVLEGTTSPSADDLVDDWGSNYLASCYAYRFRVGKAGWEQFTKSIQVDGDLLLRGNYRGVFLKQCEAEIIRLSPTLEELQELHREAPTTEPQADPEFVTADDVCRQWRRLFARACRPPS